MNLAQRLVYKYSKKKPNYYYEIDGWDLYMVIDYYINNIDDLSIREFITELIGSEPSVIGAPIKDEYIIAANILLNYNNEEKK